MPISWKWGLLVRSGSSIPDTTRLPASSVVPDVARLPFAPDFAVVTAPANVTPRLVKEAGQARSSRLHHHRCGSWSRQVLAAEAEDAARAGSRADLAIRRDCSGDDRRDRQRAAGFSGIVSAGDQLDVDLADLLDCFALDISTRAIPMHVESIRDPPLILWLSGRLIRGFRDAGASSRTGRRNFSRRRPGRRDQESVV
ncbi:hypothetical protein [Bradyrhizobium sp. CCBAU 51765]|uniref:hypothetical protein n=1 Tax=Bradyrhizobium sp. CCBAU 51765 TaxID=1325102 RepID=UPI00352E2AB5